MGNNFYICVLLFLPCNGLKPIVHWNEIVVVIVLSFFSLRLPFCGDVYLFIYWWCVLDLLVYKKIMSIAWNYKCYWFRMCRFFQHFFFFFSKPRNNTYSIDQCTWVAHGWKKLLLEGNSCWVFRFWSLIVGCCKQQPKDDETPNRRWKWGPIGHHLKKKSTLHEMMFSLLKTHIFAMILKGKERRILTQRSNTQ